MELKNLSVGELEKVIEKAKALIKEKKKEAGEVNRNKLLGLKEGAKVIVIFKGEEVKAKFVAVTNSRFTVEIEDKKKSIMFDKLIGIV